MTDATDTDVMMRALADVYSYVRSRVPDWEIAEDLTQDVMVAGARRVAAGLSVETPWLIVVARNKVVDHWRSQERHRRRSRLLAGGSVVAAPEPFDVAAIERALSALRPLERAALILRNLDGLSVPDVAAHLDRSVRATEQILSRARASFRAA